VENNNLIENSLSKMEVQKRENSWRWWGTATKPKPIHLISLMIHIRWSDI
jgi:hypothetical protein